jgi:hypothetical protein
VSFTERYRGTAYDPKPFRVIAADSGVARGRTFVIVSSLALVALIAVASTSLGQPV